MRVTSVRRQDMYIPVKASSGNTRISGCNSSIPMPIPLVCPSREICLPFFSNSFALLMFPSTSPSFGANCSVAIFISSNRELEKLLKEHRECFQFKFNRM